MGSRLGAGRGAWEETEARVFAGVVSETQDEKRHENLSALMQLWSGAATDFDSLDEPRSRSDCESALSDTLDARVRVELRFRDRSWRIHPGTLLWPLDTAARVARTAEAIDADVRSALGFSSGDLVEEALRHAQGQADIWDSSDGAAAAVAVRGYFKDVPVDLPQPVAPWVVRPAAEVSGFLDRCYPPRCLFVTTCNGTRPLPAPYVLGELEDAIRRIVRCVYGEGDADRLARTQERVQTGILDLLATTLRGVPSSVIGPATVDRGNAPLILVCPGHRHLVIVAAVAVLSEDGLRPALQAAEEETARFVGGATASLPAGEPFPESGPDLPLRFVHGPDSTALQIGPGVECVRILLVDGLDAPLNRAVGGAIVISVDEFRRLSHVAAADPEELWAFFDEVAAWSATGDFIAPSLLDAWGVWRRLGCLSVSPEPEEVPVDLTAEARVEWERDGALTRVDQTLAAVDGPTSSQWPLAAVEDDGVVTLWSRDPYVLGSVCSDPEFVVLLVAEPHPSAPSPPPGPFLKDALVSTLLRLPHGFIRDLSMEDGRPPLIKLVSATLDVPVQLAEVAPTQIVIVYDENAATRAPAPDIHQLLGEALANVAAVSKEGGVIAGEDGRPSSFSEEGNARRKRFLSGWCEHPPAVMKFWYVTPYERQPVGEALAVTREMMFRARRSAFGHFPSGVNESLGSLPDIAAQIRRALMSALRAQVREFDPRESLKIAVNEWDRARARSIRVAVAGAAARLSPWTPIPRSGVSTSLQTRASELLVETLATHPPGGRQIPDQRDLLAWLSLAALTIEDFGMLHLAETGAGAVTLALLPSRGYLVTAETDLIFDTAAYLRAVEEAQAHMKEEELHGVPPPMASEENDFRPFEDYWTECLEGSAHGDAGVALRQMAVDTAMKHEWGCGLSSLVATLSVATAIEPDPLSDAVLRPVSALVDEIVQWSRVPRDEVSEAVRILTYSRSTIDERTPLWSIEQRPDRLGAHPLIPDVGSAEGHGSVWIAPRAVAASQLIFMSCVIEGRLPWTMKKAPPAVADALDRWRQHLDKSFEDGVAGVFAACGLPHRKRLKPSRAARAGLVGLPGEIDVVAADMARQRLYVVEAKRIKRSLDPLEWVYDVTDFLGDADTPSPVRTRQSRSTKPRVVAKLLSKCAHVRDNLPQVQAMLGIDGRDVPWRVVPLIVTAAPHPAAFAPNPDAVITIAHYLHSLLERDDDPVLGWYEP